MEGHKDFLHRVEEIRSDGESVVDTSVGVWGRAVRYWSYFLG